LSRIIFVFLKFFWEEFFRGDFVKLWKNAVLFYLGGLGYFCLELLWRGWSHGSMFLAGGTCFLLLGAINRTHAPLPLKAMAGALAITAVELAAGLLVNREYTVWDYRDQPGNFLGQICPGFTLLWIPVAMAAMCLYGPLETEIRRRTAPPA